jgi:hypothetical protein
VGPKRNTKVLRLSKGDGGAGREMALVLSLGVFGLTSQSFWKLDHPLAGPRLIPAQREAGPLGVDAALTL